MSLESYLDKPYRLSSSENFDEYMKALGVNFVTRKVGNSISPTMILHMKDGVYELETQSTFKNSKISFTPGVEFDEETIDGRKVKSVVTIEGNKMIQIQKGEKETKIEREWTDEEMKAVITMGDIVCTRVYKLVA